MKRVLKTLIAMFMVAITVGVSVIPHNALERNIYDAFTSSLGQAVRSYAELKNVEGINIPMSAGVYDVRMSLKYTVQTLNRFYCEGFLTLDERNTAIKNGIILMNVMGESPAQLRLDTAGSYKYYIAWKEDGSSFFGESTWKDVYLAVASGNWYWAEYSVDAKNKMMEYDNTYRKIQYGERTIESFGCEKSRATIDVGAGNYDSTIAGKKCPNIFLPQVVMTVTDGIYHYGNGLVKPFMYQKADGFTPFGLSTFKSEASPSQAEIDNVLAGNYDFDVWTEEEFAVFNELFDFDTYMTSLQAVSPERAEAVYALDRYGKDYTNDEMILSKADFINTGVYEGLEFSKAFSLKAYKEFNPDLAAQFGDNWESYLRHYMTMGKAEGRVCTY